MRERVQHLFEPLRHVNPPWCPGGICDHGQTMLAVGTEAGRVKMYKASTGEVQSLSPLETESPVAFSVSLGLTDYSQVGMRGPQFKSVIPMHGKSPGSPNW